MKTFDETVFYNTQADQIDNFRRIFNKTKITTLWFFSTKNSILQNPFNNQNKLQHTN